jgi:hypothetical protein
MAFALFDFSCVEDGLGFFMEFYWGMSPMRLQ